MAYVLDEELVRRQLPSTFKKSLIYLNGEELTVNRLKIESASFINVFDFTYQVSGLVKISIIKEDGEYEELYSYTTKINVNKDDEIENCENIYLNKLQ